ncbi:MAG: hypothetical protein ACREIT_08255 [Tepidisphaeraceae bacterium]
MNDPIVTEVRAAREELLRKFNYDFEAYSRDAQRRQTESGHKVVRLLPKRVPHDVQAPRSVKP